MNKINQKEFLRRAKIKNGNLVDYSKTIYKTMHTKTQFICPNHGMFE